MKLVLPVPPLTQEQVLETLNGIENLPTLPVFVSRIVQTVEAGEAGARELTEVLRADQAISIQVLRVANSAFYGMRARVASLDRAIMVLGFDEVKRIALSASVMNALPKAAGPAGFRLEDFWVHSLGAAHAARFVMEALGERTADDAYTAGLLHDIGKLITCQFFPQHFGLLVHYVRQLHRPAAEIEPEILGADHALIGRWIATTWGLPSTLVEAIGRHHAIDPDADPPAPGRRLPHVTALANLITKRVGIGESLGGIQPIPFELTSRLGLTDGDVRAISARLADARAAIRSFFT